MKRSLKNKKGVTILEGLIALMLLALISVGTFSVLLSSSRKTASPDLREDMTLSIERAHHALQAFAVGLDPEMMESTNFSAASDNSRSLEGTIESLRMDPSNISSVAPKYFWRGIMERIDNGNSINYAKLGGLLNNQEIANYEGYNFSMASVLCSNRSQLSIVPEVITADMVPSHTIVDVYGITNTMMKDSPHGWSDLPKFRRIKFTVRCEGAAL